jgi:initiation factor 1A
MPKKKKCGKNTKSKGSNVEKRKLVEADLDGQVYGFLEKALGDRFFTVNCTDNTIRRCKVRQKRMKCVVGHCVIISLRNFDDNNGDIIYKYDEEEVRLLRKAGILPSVEAMGTTIVDEEEDDGFDFENI